ncbi:hypothetical protein CY34DRAFT_806407 [Suillus luteus UH-Slu-Lm8-n1]|uniref:Uncharacterized protein n=1 Tax=Suillus luteus UH-Slu-Lm8-n1 TaxID=930992 RepID=A0A0D0B3U0_9AGAM|nr:hypothetical protein CY34DRAFT_806407 [Suillus luteus UH-Slu-Lm8-n1]
MVETLKTLSTGTLNLRFMQNARRAQQLDVELEKAHVKDDAEWEVAPDIRKAWGNSDSNEDLYEKSYMPFLFSETSSKGRRKFNKNGEESSKPPEVRTATPPADDETRKTKIKSISSSSSNSNKASKKLKEPASRVIYDNSNVGVDLGTKSLSSNRTSSTSVPSASGSNAFMKPAGVDDPSFLHDSFARKEKRRQEQDNEEVETKKRKKKNISFVE